MHAIAMGLSRALAMLGGLVLAALVLMTCLSIVGRQLNILLHSDLAQSVAPGLAAALLGMGVGPIFGDYELTELGMGFAIFCFLPLCQITAGHARVDIFTSFLSESAQRWLRLIIEMVFSAALILIAWRLSVGMTRRLNTGQTTYLLELPYWWPYAACFAAASVTALVGVYMVWVRLQEALSGHDIIAEGGEGEH